MLSVLSATNHSEHKYIKVNWDEDKKKQKIEKKRERNERERNEWEWAIDTFLFADEKGEKARGILIRVNLYSVITSWNSRWDLFREDCFCIRYVHDDLSISCPGPLLCPPPPPPPRCPARLVLDFGICLTIKLLRKPESGKWGSLIYAEKLVHVPPYPLSHSSTWDSRALLEINTQMPFSIFQGPWFRKSVPPVHCFVSVLTPKASKSIGNTSSLTLHPLQCFLGQLALQPISRAFPLRSFPVP